MPSVVWSIALALLLASAPAGYAAIVTSEPTTSTKVVLVGYDDATAYPPLENGAGSAPACPCPPAGQWMWLDVVVLHDGEPVPDSSVIIKSPARTYGRTTDDSGTIRILVPAVASSDAVLSVQVFVAEQGQFSSPADEYRWLVGPPLLSATKSRHFAPDGAWNSYTLDFPALTYADISIDLGLGGTPTSGGYAGIASASFSSTEGGVFDAASAFVGSRESALSFHSDLVSAAADARISGVVVGAPGEGFGFSGDVAPGTMVANITIGRVGLDGDPVYGLHVFPPDAVEVTLVASGSFHAATPTRRLAAVDVVGVGPSVGATRASLELPTSHGVVLQAAWTNPFTPGEVAIGHDAERRAKQATGLDGAKSITSASSGACGGTWYAEVLGPVSHTQARVGVAFAEGLVLPAWRLSLPSLFPCDS